LTKVQFHKIKQLIRRLRGIGDVTLEEKPAPPSDLNALRTISEIMKRQKERDKERIHTQCRESWENERHLNLLELRDLGYLGLNAGEILKTHPFFAIDQAIAQIRTAFGIHRNSFTLMIRDYGGFHAGLLYRDIPDYNQLSAEITQKLFQFVFSASSLIQAYRRFLSAAPYYREPFERARCKIFDNPGLSAFVQNLRNCYSHRNIISVSPKSSIRMGEERGVLSSVEFDKSELLEIPKAWNVEARGFIENAERLDVMEIVSDYYTRTKKLYESYLSETGVVRSYGFADLARSREAQKAISRIIWLGIVMQNAKKNSINPYNYFSGYFTEEESQRIYCLPANSRQQVNYMISLRDPLGLCDDDLRKKLYELFDC